MSDMVREMTLQEEIEALPIDENIKDRLLCKLKDMTILQRNIEL